MSDVVLYTILILTAIGAVAAIILFFVAKKFNVIEDPRIDDVDEVLPSANCGGCGYPGCRAFAEACASAESLDGLYCTPGGAETMNAVADILGLVADAKTPQVAVLLCNGSLANRKRTSEFDSAANCTIAASTYGGETDCTHGCLGLGECVDACGFDAMYMDPETGLPVVIEDMCTACGGCVEACPKDLFELRDKGKKSKRIFVSCMNTDKGAPAKKACDVACIGCGKCVKECNYDAITMANNKAYIDYKACVLCRKCVAVCPTGAIHELNFPARKIKPAVDAAAAPKKVVAKKAVAEVEKPIDIVAQTKEAKATKVSEITQNIIEKKSEEAKERNNEDKSADQ